MPTEDAPGAGLFRVKAIAVMPMPMLDLVFMRLSFAEGLLPSPDEQTHGRNLLLMPDQASALVLRLQQCIASLGEASPPDGEEQRH